MFRNLVLLFGFIFVLSTNGNSQVVNVTFQFPTGDTICAGQSAMLVLIGSSGDSIVANWGDGSQTTITPPFQRAGHVFASVGSYTMNFTAHSGGSTSTGNLVITVVAPPNVDFTYTFTDTCVKPNLQVNFTDQSDPGLTNYLWNFGDGTTAGTSTQTNPSYVYANPAAYRVSLTAENNRCPNTKTKTLELPYDTNLVLSITDLEDCPCNKIDLSATGTASNWLWEFGDGRASTQQNVTHTFSEPGAYVVTIKGTDPVSGCEYQIGKTVDVCPNDQNIFPTKSNNNWFFYDKCGLDFTGGAPVFAPGSQPSNTLGEGGATISHPTTGAMLFYTNGRDVWDRTHSLMPTGTGLFGNNSSTESALIIPKPGNFDEYYIFTSSGASSGQQGYYYSVVDMNLNGGNGDVTTKNSAFYANPGNKPEALKGVVKDPAANCNDAEYWVIIPSGQDQFHSYPVTNTGVGLPVVSNVPNAAVPAKMNRAVNGSAISPNRRMYAVVEGAISGPDYRIRLMHFDPQTGVLSNWRFIDPLVNSSYGVSFSPDNTKFYVGALEMLIQYDITDNFKPTYFPMSNYVRTIQIGDDGKLYFVIEDSGSLGVINNPNLSGTACNVNAAGVFLNGNETRQGLQNAVPLQFSIPDTSKAAFSTNFSAPFCDLEVLLTNTSDTLPTPDPCSFYPDDTLSYFWNFGDGTTSPLQHPGSHVYATTGTYTISLQVFRPRTCVADTATQVVTLLGPPPTNTITPSPGCDSIFYSGTWYFSTQSINDTLFSGAANGCDSINMVNLVVGTSSTSTITPLSCGNYLSPGGNVYTTSGTYLDTLLSVSNCDSIIQVDLTVIDSVVSNQVQSECDSALINGNWYYASQQVRDTLSGAAVNGCDSIVSTVLTITNSSLSNSIENICNGQAIMIHGTNQSIAGVYTQTFTSSITGCDSISSVTLNVNTASVNNISVDECDSVLINGNWVFTSSIVNDTIVAGSSNGCDSIIIANVTISNTPTLSATAQPDSVVRGNSITLTGSGANAYLWDNGEATTSIVVSPSTTTSYCVIGYNGSCTDTICIDAIILECADGILYFPNAFSPNNDGANDELCVFGTQCLKTYQFSIYNRWGEAVFESNDPTQCWDGNFRGKEANSGVFSYVLNAVDDNDNGIVSKGNITLLR